MFNGQATSGEEVCRILVIGSNRSRLDKVISLLIPGSSKNNSSRLGIQFDFLACVARFASYKDEVKGNDVRYLVSVEYFPYDHAVGSLSTAPSSLLPFFDDPGTDVKGDMSSTLSNQRVALFSGVAGAAIGSGIEGKEDSNRIEAFLMTMMSGCNRKDTFQIKTIQPNAGFRSMVEEIAAYQKLSVCEKEEVTRHQTMGAAKMAKFVTDFSTELALNVIGQTNMHPLPDSKAETTIVAPIIEHVIEANKIRYSCRICRTILFGENDLQSPPHVPSQHLFSYRKKNHGSCNMSGNSPCQSYFLQDSLEWMGDEIRNGYPDGKFGCPFCDAKLGNWIWSGTQCSCGTWVVPAIQIPKGKVDAISPRIDPSSPTENVGIQSFPGVCTHVDNEL